MELRSKITAIYVDSVREKLHAALSNSGGLSPEQITDMLEPWDLVLNALVGESNPTTLHLDGHFADAVRILTEKYDDQAAETPEEELEELKGALRLHFLHADSNVRASAGTLLRFVAQDSVVPE